MNCQETINLWSCYHDAELDEAFCREIRRHLEACPECRRFFEAQQQFDAALTQSLNRGQRNESLWRREESAIRAAYSPARPRATPLSFWAELLLAWPGPKFYGALAAVWILLLAANWLADAGGVAKAEPLSAVQGSVFAEQRRQLRALLMASDYEQPRPTVTLPGPRSQWRATPESFPVGCYDKLDENAKHQPELA
jgi:anti-sigma factor RsiW